MKTGSSKRIERVYFEIKESNIEQWEKPQIKESKRAFFYSIVTEGGDKEKLEAFINFCEDAIFEMQHASALMAVEESGGGGPARATTYSYMTDEDEQRYVSMCWSGQGVIDGDLGVAKIQFDDLIRPLKTVSTTACPR